MFRIPEKIALGIQYAFNWRPVLINIYLKLQCLRFYAARGRYIQNNNNNGFA